MSHRIRRIVRLTLGLFVPHTVVLAAKELSRRRLRRRFEDARKGAARTLEAGEEPREFSYEEAVWLLVSRGLDEEAVRLGSIQEKSIRFAGEVIRRHASRGALKALHIGNYVGLSLAGLSDLLTRHDPESLVVSIDPNLPHLGVVDPETHTLAVLGHFGLQGNNVLIRGYSLGGSAAGPGASSARETACEHTLANLERLGERFDLALVDGNHDPEYLREEIDVILRLLSEGGLLILDDVSRFHKPVLALFDEISADSSVPLEVVGQDERLGILRKTAAPRGSGMGAAGFEPATSRV